MWSVIVLAFDGPTPILTSVMPSLFFALQMIGRHLRKVARRFRLRPAGGARRRREDQIPRRDEARVAVLADLLAAELDELVDVALIVGEEHEVLEMLRRGAGVVLQPRERIVDALGGEERQRARLAGCRDECAVGDRIVGRRKVGEGEMRLQRAQVRLRDVGDALLDHEGKRDRPAADPDMHRHLVVLQDVARSALRSSGRRGRGG